MSNHRPRSNNGPSTGQRGEEGLRNRFCGDIDYEFSDPSRHSGSGRNGHKSQAQTPQEQLLAQHTKKARHIRDVDCSICMSPLAEESPYAGKSAGLRGSVALKLCGHKFHASCLNQLAAHDTSCLTCPNCHTIHGIRTGTQPEGDMEVVKMLDSLPGFEGYRAIRITYSFPRGVQGPEHPNPGRPYRLNGFPRVAYLPDTEKGNLVRKLLRVAFDRRLVFTVGTSSTTDTPDCVVWNGIHHKTEINNHGGHGYPDPSYLDNVIKELACLGVTKESMEQNV